MNGYLRIRGFSLIEIVIVACIATVLLTIALPGYREHLLRTRRAVATSVLVGVLARQEQFFIEHKRYAESLSSLGYPDSPFAVDAEGNRLTAAAPEGMYLIDITTLPEGFELQAQPRQAQGADHACGTLTLNWQGVKTVSGIRSAAHCW